MLTFKQLNELLVLHAGAVKLSTKLNGKVGELAARRRLLDRWCTVNDDVAARDPRRASLAAIKLAEAPGVLPEVLAAVRVRYRRIITQVAKQDLAAALVLPVSPHLSGARALGLLEFQRTILAWDLHQGLRLVTELLQNPDAVRSQKESSAALLLHAIASDCGSDKNHHTALGQSDVAKGYLPFIEVVLANAPFSLDVTMHALRTWRPLLDAVAQNEVNGTQVAATYVGKFAAKLSYKMDFVDEEVARGVIGVWRDFVGNRLAHENFPAALTLVRRETRPFSNLSERNILFRAACAMENEFKSRGYIHAPSFAAL